MSRVLLASIDLGGVEQRFDRDKWRMIVNNIADVALLQWQSWAQRKFSARSATRYTAGLTKVETPHGVSLVLAGVFPLMLEQGWYEGGGIDLRKTLLKGSRVKSGPNGRYRVIMFRHQQGGAGHAGELVGAAHERAGHSASDVDDVRRRVRSAVRGSQTSGRGADGRFNYNEFNADTARVRQRHAGSIHNRMIRVSGGRGLRTFRTISENPATFRSDSTGRNWHHPGIVGAKLRPRVQRFIQQATPIEVERVMGGAAP